ncbi:cyclic 3',5'-adenosine monophosphate phosphodiesterase [Xenorhabdus mauleonii]|uniref:Cyclic 3',5'-adenosine monophosphate phosphodiesterase n=1 Tax=Xenorhabdus mauleonii TaxID=351675 RepID=A0A1I3KTF0_9GAMM|nr:metallophosphoesterase [Xenorhabdus mauleonii]PHM45153.1 cyclic 3',5'-adenosine monophosphate phosphodiesterase [Xenorhabdus mauleonii]SFI75821.1 Icc protein [Xenorhabdus mauleonii]
MKVIHLTDIHLTRTKDQKMFNVNPYDNFDFVCQEISRIKEISEIELIIVSGDITHDGDIEAYRYFLDKMESLKKPYFAILGNHDLKENFDIVLAEEKREYIVNSKEYNHSNWHLMSVDTVVAGEDYGAISKNNLAELERKLIEKSHLDLAIFMHHHAMPVGTPLVDSSKLNNGEALLALCEKYKVKFIGSGHAHNARIWHHNNMTVSVAPAVVFQWLPGIETVEISQGFGFNIIDFSSDVSITSCIY